MNNGDILVEGAPVQCARCGGTLCLRKQVINLSLGNTDSMNCLICLAQTEGGTAEGIIAGTADYILSRDCFKKQWVRYSSPDFCPDPAGCFPGTCFKREEKLDD